jgi:hypothetical protein
MPTLSSSFVERKVGDHDWIKLQASGGAWTDLSKAQSSGFKAKCIECMESSINVRTVDVERRNVAPLKINYQWLYLASGINHPLLLQKQLQVDTLLSNTDRVDGKLGICLLNFTQPGLTCGLRLHKHVCLNSIYQKQY